MANPAQPQGFPHTAGQNTEAAEKPTAPGNAEMQPQLQQQAQRQHMPSADRIEMQAAQQKAKAPAGIAPAAVVESHAVPPLPSSATVTEAGDLVETAGAAASGMSNLSEVAKTAATLAGKAARYFGPVGKVLSVAMAGMVAKDVINKAHAAVNDGAMTPDQAQVYRDAGLGGVALDALSPVPLNAAANNVRDALVVQGASEELRAQMQIGDPKSQISRVRDALPAKPEEGMSTDMKKLIDLNANIKALEGQEYADPSLRQKVSGMEMDLYRQFDAMRADASKRQELQRITDVPIDPAEQTYVAPPTTAELEKVRRQIGGAQATDANVAPHEVQPAPARHSNSPAAGVSH
jgi:hypothetical protein